MKRVPGTGRGAPPAPPLPRKRREDKLVGQAALFAALTDLKQTGVGNGNPLRYSCLENLMDRGAWQATVHRATESDTTSLSLFQFPYL